MSDPRTIAFYDQAAADYAKAFASQSPDASLRAFMALLPKGGRVLDLGCGPAQASAYLRAAGFTPDPVDASSGMVALANERHQIGARIMRFEELDAIEAYDGVWANFSLLHAPRAALPAHFSAIGRALRKGGVLHVGMKTGSGEGRDRLDRNYTYVTVPELDALISDAGLTVTATREGCEKGCAGTEDPFVIMLARKNG
ncbi:class I SAM-dependent DNA methyltransferase [Yoonia litorea]|uniref:Methyltransferase domain-containing protein n=1 Tax=Yoonia litorea TaxID=1123755 RepID=A0A1I6MXK4_9RHOB|nr:class I SAM-dependent methyltransferase [Yoonia litorea]SFS20394.1 Methyltransferase domain-containing protein [Yoonia litorea]